jgi:HEAT repeat protein
MEDKPEEAQPALIRAAGFSSPGNPSDLSSLIATLNLEAAKSDDPERRQAALDALGRLGVPNAVATLSDLLNQCLQQDVALGCFDVVNAASLKRPVDAELLGWLGSATTAQDPVLRYQAIRLLTEIKGDPARDVPRLIDAINANTDPVDAMIADLPARQGNARAQVLARLKASGPRALKAIPFLIDDMAIPTGTDRGDLARIVVGISGTSLADLPRILNHLPDAAEPEQIAILRNLEETSLDMQRAMTALTAAGNDENPAVRAAVAISLAGLAGSAARLTTALVDATYLPLPSESRQIASQVVETQIVAANERHPSEEIQIVGVEPGASTTIVIRQ